MTPIDLAPVAPLLGRAWRQAEVFERVQPVLRCVGRTLVHIGESGAGQVAKAVAAAVATLASAAAAFLRRRPRGRPCSRRC